MATQTSTKSGLWSDPTVWTTAVPVDADTVVIASGHTVTFNVDQSGFATGVGVTIQKGAILQASTTAGSYVLKCSAAIAGVATGAGATAALNAGSAGTPYPANCSFTININGNHFMDLTLLNFFCYGAQPVHRSVKLSAPASIGATVLNVDTDVSADAPWLVASARCNVDNINNAAQSETRLISAVSATTITLTVGLTAAKLTGAWVHLLQRNVRFTGSNNYIITHGTGCIFQGVEFSGNTGNAFWGGHNTFTGCVFASFTSIVFNNGGCCQVTSCVFTNNLGAYGSGCSIVANACTFTGNTTGVVQNGAAGCFNNCVMQGNAGSAIVIGPNLLILSGCALAFNGIDIGMVDENFATCKCIGYGTTLGSPVQVANYNLIAGGGFQGVFMWDIGNVANAYKAWMYAGTVASDTGTLPGPAAVTYTFKHIFERSGTPLFTDIPIRLAAGVNTITVYLRQDGTGRAEVPNAQLILPGSDPFFGGSAVANVAMTDTANAWQTLTLSYTSSRAQQALVRLRGTGTTGNFWGQIAVAGGGGMAPIGSSFIKGVH